MKAKKLLLFAFLIPLLSFSQSIERTAVKGLITAPLGEDVEGINIYNISSQRGTITDKDGNFEIDVAENDRVQVTAVQYQSFTVIVDEGVVKNKKMRVYLNPAINQLEEVIVRPYDLSGNVKVDVGKIKTVDFSTKFTMDYEEVEFNYGFLPDNQSSIPGNYAEKAYYNGQEQWGGNILGLVGLIFNNKKKNIREQKIAEKGAVSTGLRQRFSKNYIAKTFGIPEEDAVPFLYFLEDKGVDSALLKAQNEMELLQFMFAKVKEFKKLGE